MNHISTTSYPCLECSGESLRFPTIEELEIHIASDHLNYCPYECERCRFAKFPTEYALISHCKNDHGLKEFFVRYRFTLEGERKSTELKMRIRACVRHRGGFDDSLSLTTTNGHTTTYQGTCEKFDESDSFPSSVEPSGSSSEHTLGIVAPGSVNSGGVVPPSTSPSAIALSGTPGVPHISRITTSSNSTALHSLPTCAGSQDHSHPLHLSHGPHITTYANTFPSNSTPSTALTELSPMDFASDAINSGMDFVALIGEGEELIRKPKDAVICQICGLKVSNQRSSLVYHANTKHIKLNLYQCAVCQKTWQTIAKSDVLKHVKAIHNGDESMVIDNRKRLGYQLRMFTARCFPPKPNNKARPLTAESATQILQSFIGEGPLNTPKEEPDMEPEEGDHEENGDCLEIANSYGEGNSMQATLGCMASQQLQQQQQHQRQIIQHHEHS